METRTVWNAYHISEDPCAGITFTPNGGGRLIVVADDHGTVGAQAIELENGAIFASIFLDSGVTTFAAPNLDALLVIVRDSFRAQARDRAARSN